MPPFPTADVWWPNFKIELVSTLPLHKSLIVLYIPVSNRMFISNQNVHRVQFEESNKR